MPAPTSARRRQKRVWIPALVAIVVLVHGLIPSIPAGYHTVIRWVCCPVFFYLALKIAWEVNEALAGVYAVSAIANNPIYPLRLTDAERAGLYLVSIALAVVAIVILRSEEEPEAAAAGGTDPASGERHRRAPSAGRRRKAL